jgi:hypothetical protein
MKVGGLEGDVWFAANVSSILGDGKSIGFWMEKWIGSAQFKELYSNLFVKELDRNVVVADKGRWETDGWSWVLFQEGYLTDNDASDANDLRHLMAEYHPFDRGDKRRWIPEALGHYTVDSTYKFLQQRIVEEELCPNVIRALQKLWKNDVPSKVSIFGWRLLLDRLPTRKALHRRGILSNPHELCCAFCSNAMEDTTHIFLSCSFVKQVWHRIFNWSGFVINTHTMVWRHFLHFGSMVKSKKV